MSTEFPDRLRQHPAERFAAPVRKLDLAACFEELESEPRQATAGHRQITIVHEDALAMVLFQFDAQGELREHSVDGECTIHVLEGDLAIETSEGTHRLGANELLVLAPGVAHALVAHAPSRMLLTVHLRRSRSEARAAGGSETSSD